MLTVSEKIVALRHRHKITQKELSAMIGISPPTMVDREAGKTSWRLDELTKLAEIFGVSVKDLLDDPPNDTVQ